MEYNNGNFYGIGRYGWYKKLTPSEVAEQTAIRYCNPPSINRVFKIRETFDNKWFAGWIGATEQWSTAEVAGHEFRAADHAEKVRANMRDGKYYSVVPASSEWQECRCIGCNHYDK